MILSNQRLIFRPKGKGNGEQKNYALEDLANVVNLTNTPGFRVELKDGSKHEFQHDKRSEWYAKTLAEANSPRVKQLRATKYPSVVPAAPQSDAVASSPLHVADSSDKPKSSPVPAPPGTPGGWRSDPVHRFEQRYWDGSKWTEHVESAGRQSEDQL